jgi:hypothetical protein
MQEQEYLVTSHSTNVINEFRKYAWDKDKRTGETLNKPIDDYNHCFSGDTLIKTIKGDIPIKNIIEGDLVLTSEGYKKVLKKFNNGIKETYLYSMQFDTFFVYLRSTKEHKIKTKKEWKQISKLQKKDLLYQCKSLTEKNTNFIQTKNILAEAIKGFTSRFGNILKEKFRKVITFTMLMVIRIIMILQILTLLIKNFILNLKEKKGLKTIQLLQKSFNQKELKKLKNGISQMMAENGTQNTEKKLGLIESIKQKLVKFVAMNTKQDMLQSQNIAIKTAKLLRLEKGEKKVINVYDLMIEDCHEYFANGILVHNCIDAIRYHEMETVGLGKSKGKYFVY